MASTVQLQKRIQSIDVLRGIVMMLMALDHVRDYFHITANTADPMDLTTTSPALFLTRWITHFCAPAFIFLSGTSIYLQGLRKSKSELSKFLVTRGLWLILVEITIVTFGWSFNPFFNVLFLQVIWAIGICMFITGLVIRMPYLGFLIAGIVITLLHNLLNIPEKNLGEQALAWDLVHRGNFGYYEYLPHHGIFIIYPFLPWLGIMWLGYAAGKLFTNEVNPLYRKKVLLFSGIGAIILFTLLRYLQIYGDPQPWSVRKNFLYTVFSFVDVEKYPPSLLFACMTLGVALLALAALEKIENPVTRIARIFGRVPFFYYILHIYLAHILATIAFFSRGHTWAEGTHPKGSWLFSMAGEGYGLPVVYAVWLLVLTVLYPLCKAYDRYKTNHKHWWLSYL